MNKYISTGKAANMLRAEFGQQYHREYIMQELKCASRGGAIKADTSTRKVKLDYESARRWYLKYMHHDRYSRRISDRVYKG